MHRLTSTNPSSSGPWAGVQCNIKQLFQKEPPPLNQKRFSTHHHRLLLPPLGHHELCSSFKFVCIPCKLISTDILVLSVYLQQ